MMMRRRRVEGKTMYLSWEFYDNFRANEAGNLAYYLNMENIHGKPREFQAISSQLG
jgi:hypothetical protein